MLLSGIDNVLDRKGSNKCRDFICTVRQYKSSVIKERTAGWRADGSNVVKRTISDVTRVMGRDDD